MSKNGSDVNQNRSHDVQNVTQRKKAEDASTGSGSEIKELTSQVRLLIKKLSSVKLRLEEATTSLSLCNERQVALGNRVDGNEKHIKHLEANAQDVKLLNYTISLLQKELNTRGQEGMRNDIELAGVPEQANENLLLLFFTGVKKLGIELVEQDIQWISRMGPCSQSLNEKKKLPRQIVVSFVRRTTRDEILKASKVKRITTADIGVPDEPLKIYFNERLTKENRQLFRETRERCKQQNFNFCWCNTGVIYVRQQQGKSAQAVRSHDDLDRILGCSTGTNTT